MPFTCIVDPERLCMLMPEAAQIILPAEMRFLLEAQMAEADIIDFNGVEDALDTIAGKYNLRTRTFFVETFGMMEERRGDGGRASRYE